MFRYLAALITPCMLAGPLSAQQLALQRGSEIRVYTRLTYVVGQLLDLSPSMIVVTGKDKSVDTLDRAEVLLVRVRGADGWTDIPPEALPPTLVIPVRATTGSPGAARPRVRVFTPHGRVDGTLAAWRLDTLVVAQKHGALSVVPIAPRTWIQIQVPRSPIGVARGFFVGLLIGGASGASVGYATCHMTVFLEPPSDNCTGAALEGAAIAGVLFGGIGAVVGSMPRHKWIKVSTDSLRLLLQAPPQVKR